MSSFQEKTTPSILENAPWTSIYIPLLLSNASIELTEYDTIEKEFSRKTLKIEDESTLITMFEELLEIGKVKRVDFVVKDNNKCAFIHFHHWFENERSRLLRKEIDEKGFTKILSFMNGKLHVKFSFKHYLVLKRNFKEIPEVKEEDVPQNVHQVIHWNKQLAEENAQLKEENAKMEERIKELEERIENLIKISNSSHFNSSEMYEELIHQLETA